VYCVLDVLVPEILLQRPRIDALVCQLEAGSVPQHVRVHAERHLDLAALPSLPIMRRNPATLMGAPRSLMNT
jgi:hypothetical protein